MEAEEAQARQQQTEEVAPAQAASTDGPIPPAQAGELVQQLADEAVDDKATGIMNPLAEVKGELAVPP